MPELQVNFGIWSIDRSFPLMNLAKTGQEWASTLTNERPNPGFMDANGYLTDFSEGGTKHFLQVPTQAQRPGKLVLLASGDGTMSVAASFTAGSGNLTSSGGQIRYEFLPNSDVSAVTLQISSRGTGYISSHALIHIDDENDYVNNGKRINTQFKNRIAEAGFTTIRFLNVQFANGSAQSLRSHMGTVGSYSYACGGVPLLGSFKGTTTKVSNDFQLSGVSTSPADKTTIQFVFGQSGDANSTLMGKPLRTSWGVSTQYPADAGWSAAWTPAAGRHCITVYDSALGCWLMYGGNDVAGDVRGLMTAPLEAIIAICNETNCHPWVHIPHLAVDPLTNFTAGMATDMIAGLNPSLKPRYEVSNEVWNTAGGFWQTRYAWERQKVRTGQTGFEADQEQVDEWYGRAIAQAGEAIDTAYGGDRTRYEMMCMTQGANYPRTKRLTSPQWVTENGGNTAKAAKNWVTTGGWANYWNPHAQLGSSGTDIDAMVTEFWTATTARKAEIIAELVNDNSFTRGGIFGQTFQQFCAGQVGWMSLQGITKFRCYEGGYSPDYTSYLGSSDKDKLYRASKFSPDLVRWTLVCFLHCKLNGILEPSVFELCGPGGIWAALDTDTGPTWEQGESSIYCADSPQWTAFKLYKAGRFRFKATST